MTGRALNILFACDFPFAGAGGVGRVTETLAKEFRARGMGVTYLSFSKGEAHDSGGIMQYFTPGGNRVVSPQNERYLEHMLKELEIDVIVNQGGIKPEIIRLFKKINRGGACLLSVHHNSVAALNQNYQHIISEGYRGTRYYRLIAHPFMGRLLRGYNRLKYGRIFEEALLCSDRLILLSERFVPELSVYLKGSSYLKKVVGIPNPSPFDVVEDVETKKENRMVFVGRVNFQQKRADLLVDIWKRVYKDFPDWYFDIVGDGPDRAELEKRALNAGLERIIFHGYQDPRSFLEKAKLFCMTSAFEGYPMVLVEAQAYGVVPFAFDCFSAISEIIQSGINGYVIPKYDLELYVNKLSELIYDDQRRRTFALSGQRSVLKYQPGIICDKWEGLFETVMIERQKGSIK